MRAIVTLNHCSFAFPKFPYVLIVVTLSHYLLENGIIDSSFALSTMNFRLNNLRDVSLYLIFHTDTMEIMPTSKRQYIPPLYFITAYSTVFHSKLTHFTNL